jgi:hypothetical protein
MMAIDLVLLVGNLSMVIGKFSMMAHNFRIHPNIGLHFLIAAIVRYKFTSINANVVGAASHDTRRNTICA